MMIHDILDTLNHSDEHTLFPTYKVVGVKAIDKIQKDIATQSASSFNQSVRPKLTVETVQQKNVVIIEVEELPAPISRNASGFLRDLLSIKLIHQNGKLKSSYYIAGEHLLKYIGALPTMADDLPTKADDLPSFIKLEIEKLGKRSNKEEVKEIIYELCNWRELSSKELSFLIGKSEKYIKSEFIKELIKERKINYTIPDMIKHPGQKYRAL